MRAEVFLFENTSFARSDGLALEPLYAALAKERQAEGGKLGNAIAP